MQVNLNCNQPRPQFGMAFRRPNEIHMDAFSERLFNGEYTVQIICKALKQFEVEQAKLTRYDVRFNATDKSIEVVNNITGKIAEKTVEMGRHTGFDMFGEIRYPGRKFFASIFNPKKFLPRELYYAGERAKELEAQAIKKENQINNIL